MHWSRNLAYAIGLITTDGNLSKDGRHIELTSKDKEQIQNFIVALNIVNNKIGVKKSSYNPNGIYYRLQFSNVRLYKFLFKIGLTPNKSKSVGKLKIPDRYFADFLRGHLDGDGYTNSYWDSVFKNSFRLYTGFVSASLTHLEWLKSEIEEQYKLTGTIKIGIRSYQLKFAKKASLKLFKRVYYQDNLICLSRKRFKIERALGIIQKQAGVAESVYA